MSALACKSHAEGRCCDVPIAHVEALWPQVKPFIVRVLDRDEVGRYRPVDVLRSILDGTTRLWVSWNPDEKAVEAAVVTEIIQFPRVKELRIWIVGGNNMRAWVYEMRDMIEAFARSEGCVVMVGGLRPGWLRIGGPGWVKTGISYEKVL